MKRQRLLIWLLALQPALLAASHAAVAIPPEYAMPAGSVDTNKPGFLARPYQVADSPAGNLAWTEDQLAGLHGPNLADLSGADTNGYYAVPTLVNWNITAGGVVDDFPPADSFPGISASTVNFAEEVLTYINFPAAGTYTLGVNSDDGFNLAAANLNPKDRFTAVTLGKFDGTRGAGDTTFAVSISKAGIYPLRLVYWQVGGGASLSWFSVVTNTDSTVTTNLINDQSIPGSLVAYSSANLAPPYVTGFTHDPTGFTFIIKDDASALAPNSLKVTLNGSPVTVTTSKSGATTTASYASPTLIAPGVTNALSIQFSDNAQPAHNGTASFTFKEPAYSAIPASAALTSADVDTSKPGFLYRLNQIDSANGIMAANIAHAEAQLAGLLTDASGTPFPNNAALGEQPDGSYAINGVINFSVGGNDLGAFPADAPFPGLGDSGDNMAGEIVTYLDLKAGFYTFAVHTADGFRVTTAANAYDAFGTTLGIFDFRQTASETQFGVLVQNAGIYPIRLVFFRQTGLPNNGGSNAELEFYTVAKDASKILVNDSSKTNSVKGYWKRTAAFGPYVKYAGPSSFISPFTGPDVGFTNVTVMISDGSSAKVDPASPVLTIDGTAVTATKSSAGGLTTLSYAPQGLQLPRTVHSGKITYAETGAGAQHSNTWSFNLLRNYVLTNALYSEDFESTPAGPDPSVPAGWVEENHTGHQTAGNDPADLNSDFYLGWVVVDKSFSISKDTGVSAIAPQVLNGVAFAEDTNPLLVNHYMRAESDSRQNGPPGQIQYVTTKAYDLSGKPGIVIAFDSAYEKNQDDMVGLEVSTDNGATWSPVFYWLQGGNDSQGVSDIIRDGQGNIDVSTTMFTQYGDVAAYTDTNGVLVGHYFGFFPKAPVTQAIAPYIEGRVNDDGNESKRIELFRVPAADNQKSVKFRFFQAGTSSWYWAIDNWGIYSVPSQGGTTPQGISLSVASKDAAHITLTWTGGSGPYLVQKKVSLSDTNWTDVATTSAHTMDVLNDGTTGFFRISDNAQGTVTQFQAVLTGAGERPNPVTTTATGFGTFSLNGNNLTYNIAYSGLSSDATAGHIHGPADANTAAGVLVPFNPLPTGKSGRLTGTLSLTDAQKQNVLDGLTYANIHTLNNGGGEIRGQLIKQ